MRSINLAHYVTLTEVDQFGDWGMPIIYYVASHNIYVMNPRIFPEFQRMMRAAGMELSLFGVNNA